MIFDNVLLWQIIYYIGRIVKALVYIWTYPSWYFVAILSVLLTLVLYQCFTDVKNTNQVRDASATRTGPRAGKYSAVKGRPCPISPSDLYLAVNPLADPLFIASSNKSALLRSIRIFGDAFDEPDLNELVASLETVHLHNGNVLCNIGEPDEHIYILQSGQLHVSSANDTKAAPLAVRIVRIPGESVYSVISVLEALNGFLNRKRLSRITAVGGTVVVKLSINTLKTVLSKNPESTLRVVQLIMMWIHRVLLVALLSFLRLDGNAMMKMAKLPIVPQRERGESLDKPSSFRRSVHTFVPYRRSDSQSAELESISPDADFRWGVKELKSKLKLDNLSMFENKLKYLSVPAATLIVQATESDAPLLFVVSGCLSAWIKQPEDYTDENTMEAFTINRGEMFSGLAVLSGEPMLFQVESKVVTKLIAIHRHDFHEMIRMRPQIVSSIAQSVISRLSPFVRLIDFALDWVHIDAGQVLYRQGDEPGNIFVVLAGRIRGIVSRESTNDLTRDYCRGDLIGLVEVYCRIPRFSTMMAVRDAEIVRIPVPLLNFLVSHYPALVTRLIRYLGKSVASALHKVTNPENPMNGLTQLPSNPETLTTIAVVPCDKFTPLDTFAMELEHAFSDICRTVRICSDDVRRAIGKRALEPVSEARLSAWLAQSEAENRIVLYQCDHSLSLWTKRSLRQADCILLVGMGDRCPTCKADAVLQDIDEYINSCATSLRARKDLVLLHKHDTKIPRYTAEWLDHHEWCFLHHHIRCPARMFQPRRSKNFQEYYQSLIPPMIDKHSDFARLARILSGTGIGMVLGGGGARGFAHVGMLEAMKEADIPIDMIAGVSMGSFISALWALKYNIPDVRLMGKYWADNVLRPWNLAREFTYPYMAMFRGRWFNEILRTLFDDIQIENLWIPYFCVSTDVTDLGARSHGRGALWRYVRASMTIAGFLPPICDPVDGHLLIDGGYTNNLPADVMRQRGAGIVLAIDVGRENDRQTFAYGDEFSGWTALKHKFWPWGATISLPDIAELLSRLACTGSINTLEDFQKAPWCCYIRPPITSYQTLEFKSYDEVVDVGYYFGQMTFSEDGLVWSKLADMERQLLTTSFGLYIPHLAQQPVLGQYLADLASYVLVKEEPEEHTHEPEEQAAPNKNPQPDQRIEQDQDLEYRANAHILKRNKNDHEPVQIVVQHETQDDLDTERSSFDASWKVAEHLSDVDLPPTALKIAESFWAYS
ncbi:patatin-like phospholipase domain-containing protein 7 isoform X2 [Paramacrobiotus metropolitanus]|uniref:patatin-like phospholipase domain-containing protein 7 isoform X2 n=1 Tax=Paramacrobiotus metropolitanus TaxID=2943436 RepID=UPI0024463F39|nr:patatin-like phospholipase domain-containing protein 7 isoform X2 [Paramacrobiotus metropolitanus]